MLSKEHKKLTSGKILRVTRLCARGNARAHRLKKHDYDRDIFREVGFIGRVTAIHEDCVFLNSLTQASVRESRHVSSVPSSVFEYEEVEYATSEEVEYYKKESGDTSITRWLTK